MGYLPVRTRYNSLELVFQIFGVHALHVYTHLDAHVCTLVYTRVSGALSVFLHLLI